MALPPDEATPPRPKPTDPGRGLEAPVPKTDFPPPPAVPPQNSLQGTDSPGDQTSFQPELPLDVPPQTIQPSQDADEVPSPSAPESGYDSWETSPPPEDEVVKEKTESSTETGLVPMDYGSGGGE